MKRIKYVDESIASLHDYRRIDGSLASWDRYRSFRDGADNLLYRQLIDELVRNQHGICGYCEMRIDNGNRQVEHVVPRSVCPELELEGTNLIACCSGGSNEKTENRGGKDSLSCGQKKGSSVLPDIADPRTVPCVPSLLIVGADGEISANSGLVGELGLEMREVSDAIELLGLNARRLQVMRREVWEDLERMVMSEVEDLGTEAKKLEKGKDLALKMLMPRSDSGELQPFFTTIRSFFGKAAEAVLHERLPEWI